MIGGPIGLGVGVPLITTTTVVQSGAFDIDGLATIDATGRSTAAANADIAGLSPIQFTGRSTAAASFLLEQDATVVWVGRATGEAVAAMQGLAAIGFSGLSTAQSDAAIAGSTTLNGAGGSTAHSAFDIQTGIASLFAGQSTASVSFTFAGSGAFNADGLTRTLTTFDISATSEFDFRNVPLLAGAANISGISTPEFAGAFSVLPTKDAVPAINSGKGRAKIVAGRGTYAIRGGGSHKDIGL